MTVRLLFSSMGVIVLATVGYAGLGLAQEPGISPDHHPWGRFPPGAWKLVRVVSETLDENGLVASTSTTDTKTTLTKAEGDGVTLQLEVCVEVAGKRFAAEPQVVKQSFLGEPLGQNLKTKEVGTGQVVIEGRKLPCRVLQLESSGPTSKTTTTIHYCGGVAPHILKRESTTTALQGNNSVSETVVDVVALDMPIKVLAEIKSTAFVRTVHKHPKGTITTWAATSTEVPGGVIRHSSKESDLNGRLARRSTLELVGYGVEAEPERTGLFGRKRPARLYRSSAYPVTE